LLGNNYRFREAIAFALGLQVAPLEDCEKWMGRQAEVSKGKDCPRFLMEISTTRIQMPMLKETFMH